MSAAATAAGYLYASGRLRGRGQREEQQEQSQGEKSAPSKPERRPKVAALRKEVRVAALPPSGEHEAAPPRPRRQPTIQYRTRRWKPEADAE